MALKELDKYRIKYILKRDDLKENMQNSMTCGKVPLKYYEIKILCSILFVNIYLSSASAMAERLKDYFFIRSVTRR